MTEHWTHRFAEFAFGVIWLVMTSIAVATAVHWYWNCR